MSEDLHTTACPRCGGSMQMYSMSYFNRDVICIDCKKEEAGAPNYQAARKADEEALTRGEYNFPGIGLAPEDEEYLALRRGLRMLTPKVKSA